MALRDGTKVSLIDGEFKGSKATVVGYHVHDPITYAVLLDEPVVREVKQDVNVPGVGMMTKIEMVTFTRIEVAEKDVQAA